MQRATRYLYVSLIASACLLSTACGDDDGQDGDEPGPVEDAVSDMGTSDTSSQDDTTPRDVSETDDTGSPDDQDTGGEDTTTSSDTTDTSRENGDTASSDTMDTSRDAGDATSDAMDTTPDAGAGSPMYRVLATSEDAQGGTSNYFAMRFGGGQSPTVLPAGSPTTYSYGEGDIALDRSGNRLFVLNQLCAQSQQGCSKSSGRIRQVTFNANGALQNQRTLTFENGVYNPKGIGYVPSTQRYYATSGLDAALQLFDSSGSRISSNTQSYDTSQFDPDGSQGDMDPEPDDVIVDGDYVLVALQALDGFSPANNSRMAVIDTANQQWVDFDSNTSGTQALTLPGKNAFGGFVRTGTGDFAVGLTGEFSTTSDSKIVIVEKTAPGQYTVGSTVVEGPDLGGNVTGIAMLDETRGFATVLKGRATKVVYFEASGGSVNVQTVPGLNDPAGAICLSPDRKRLFVADDSGYLAYDTQTQQKLTSQPVGPNNLATSRDCVVTMP